MVEVNLPERFEFDEMKELSLDEAASHFMAAIIITASSGYIFLSFSSESSLFSLSTIFYSIVPVSLSLIMFLTYRVVKTIHRYTIEGGKAMGELLIGLTISAAALNLGFITILTSGPKVIEGRAGMYKFILMGVLLSFAMTTSLVLDRTDL